MPTGSKARRSGPATAGPGARRSASKSSIALALSEAADASFATDQPSRARAERHWAAEISVLGRADKERKRAIVMTLFDLPRLHKRARPDKVSRSILPLHHKDVGKIIDDIKIDADAAIRLLLRALPYRILCLEYALWCLGAPDSDQVRLRPFEVQLLRPHEDQWMAFVVSGDEERTRLGLHEDLPLFESYLEYQRVFVRALPYPELAMRF
jgi:hypothetical protein